MTHYLAVHALFPGPAPEIFNFLLLTFSTMENEADHSTQLHFETICYVQHTIYHKPWQTFVALIQGNCATNHALAKIANCIYIRCVSNFYQHAIRYIIIDYNDKIKKTMSIMSKLHRLKNKARLMLFTSLVL